VIGENALYWLVKWPWIAAIVVFLGIAQLPLGPWYVSAWFAIGAALLAMILFRAVKLALAEAMALRSRGERPIRLVRHRDAEVRL
jgi:membrane protein implicated in regulation of membrane protease activity